MQEHPKTLEFIGELITEQGLECEIHEGSPGYVVKVTNEGRTVEVAFSKDGIIDDVEYAMNAHGRGTYYSTVTNDLMFWIYLKLGPEGFIPNLCISDKLLNEIRSWDDNYTYSVSFDDQMTTALIDGIRFMSRSIESLIETYGSLDLKDVEHERQELERFLKHHSENGNLNESSASLLSLGYLKAGAIFTIIELEKAKKKTRIKKVIRALDDKIYHIVYRLRERDFVNTELPEIVYTIEEYMDEQNETIVPPEQSIPSTTNDGTPRGLVLQNGQEKYDVAFSLAHEQHEYVDKVHEYLARNARDLKVFYYRDEGQETNLWGKNQFEYLQKVYRDSSTHVIIFISADYVRKRWARHEWHSVQEAILDRNAEYLLPARFDGTDLPGLPETTVYLDLSNKSPHQFARIIIQKINSLK